MAYMKPRPKSRSDLYAKIRIRKPVDKHSMLMGIVYSDDYRKYLQERKEREERERNEFIYKLENNLLED